jgi:hypothetical protein
VSRMRFSRKVIVSLRLALEAPAEPGPLSDLDGD